MSNPVKPLILDDVAPNRRSLSDDVVDRLRDAIVQATFAPGQRLSEAVLAEAFGVSRGPIREAIAKLEREGLLRVEKHRGARVTHLSRSDIDEIYELRLALERLAVERAVRLATDDDFALLTGAVAALASAVDRKDAFHAVACDVQFHDLIYRAARHERLYQSWGLLRPQIETFLNARPVAENTHLDKTVVEHADLLEVLRARKGDDAIGMIEAHVRSAYERVTRFL